MGSKSRRQSKTKVMSSINFAKRYFDGRSLLRYLPLFNTTNDTLNRPGRLPAAACPSSLNPRQASSEEGQQSSDFLCTFRRT
jgi:hypothetical protein